MIARIVILTTIAAVAWAGAVAADDAASRTDEAAQSVASDAAASSASADEPSPAGRLTPSPEPPMPTAQPPAESDDASAAPERKASAPKSSPLSWLTDPLRKVFAPSGGAGRSGGWGNGAATRSRNATRRTAADDASAVPDAPLPMDTRTAVKHFEPASTPAASQPTEPVVATRFMGTPERRPAESGESGLSSGSGGRESAAARLSVDQLLEKGAASLQIGAVSLAANYFREAIAESPDDPTVVVRAGVLALRHNRPELTVDLVEPAIQRFAGADSPRQVLAMAKYRRGEYLGARALLLQALAIDKSSAVTHYVLGCTLAKLDQREQAESHLRQAAQLDPKYAALQ